MNEEEKDILIKDLKTEKNDLNLIIDCLTRYMIRIKKMRLWERVYFLITGKFNF